MQHSVKELLEKINAMRDRALLLNSLVDQKMDKDHWQHHLDQIQTMADEISNDRSGDNFQLTSTSMCGNMVLIIMQAGDYV